MPDFKKLLLVAPILVLLSGCVNTQSPQGVAALALEGVKTGHLRSLEIALGGEARARYGTPAGLVELQRDLENRQLSLGKLSILDDHHEPAGPGRVAWLGYRVYSQKILSQAPEQTSPTDYLDLKIRCDWHPVQSGMQMEHCHIIAIDWL